MAAGLEIRQQRSLHLGRWFTLVVLIALVGVVGWFGYRYYSTGEQPPVPIPAALAAVNPDVDESTIALEDVRKHVVSTEQPRYLSIPSLYIDEARVFSVGTKANSELDTPRNIHDVGWYEKSATPGSGSSAMLMDGHNGGPTSSGVFERLGDLQKNDEIIVERGDGTKFTYLVQEKEIVSLEDLNKGGMNRMTKSASSTAEGLNIISCTGNWIPAKNTYDQRVTIRAVIKE